MADGIRRMDSALSMPRPRYASDKVVMLGDVVRTGPRAGAGEIIGQVWVMRYVEKGGNHEVWLSLHLDDHPFSTSSEVFRPRDVELVERLGDGG